MKKTASWILLLMCVALAHVGLYSQTRKIDSLLGKLQEPIGLKTKIRVMQRLSFAYYNLAAVDSAMIWAERAITLSSGADSLKEQLGYSYQSKANALEKMGKYTEALSNFNKGEGIFKELGDKKGLSKIYSNIGNVFFYQGNYVEALKYQLQSLKGSELSGDKKQMAMTLNNIGIICQLQKDYDQAIDRYKEALELNKELKIESWAAINYLNIANIYFLKSDFPEAEAWYFKALELSKKLSNESSVSAIYVNLSILYLKVDNIEKALEYGKEGLQRSEKIGDKRNIAQARFTLGNVYLKINDRKRARENYDKAMQGFVNFKGLEGMKETYFKLSKLDSMDGDFRSAFKNFKEYITCRDSITNDENTKRSVQLQMQYDFDKQQVADSIRNAEHIAKESLKHNEEIKQQRIYTYGGVAGFVLMLIVALVSFRAYRQKQRTNAIISQQKALVDQKQKEILDSIHYAKRIQSALITNEKYISKSIERLKKD